MFYQRKFFKKHIYLLLITIFFISFSSVNVKGVQNPPTVAADGAVLMDAETGEILYSKNIHTPYPPASTTKIMTALITFEKCKLEDVVTVSKNSENVDGSRIYIFNGEKIKVKDLLYGLLLASGNDCAEALAEHIAGSEENFVKIMNERAKELGCSNTNFVNPHGLYDDKHRTTVNDLALIMKELVKHDAYREISKTSTYTISPTNKSKAARPLLNHNKLIRKNEEYYYPYCEGAKTGYTSQSAHSYVASANKNGRRLIVALIHDEKKNFFSDAITLFNYGFNNSELVKKFSKGDNISSYNIPNTSMVLPLLAGEDFYIVKSKESIENITQNPLKIESIHVQDNEVSKGILKGDTLGKATINYKGTSRMLKLISGTNYTPTKNVVTKITKSISVKNKLLLSILFLMLIFFSLRFLKIRKIKRKRKKSFKINP